MDCYFDIRLLPDTGFPGSVLMGVIYGKFHRALVALNATDIGISFPGYRKKPKRLGSVLRIHGELNKLAQLQTGEWQKGMRDYIDVGAVQFVPPTVQHYFVKRRQYKTNPERLRRRRMKRKNENYEQALQAIPCTMARNPDLPFVTLRSSSTTQMFCLFIEQSIPQEQSVTGNFNSYGLSLGATVPYF